MSLSSLVRISSQKELRGQKGLHPLLNAFVDVDQSAPQRDRDRLIYLDLPRGGLAIIEATMNSGRIVELFQATLHPAGLREHLLVIWEASINWARSQRAVAVQIIYLKQSGSGDVLAEMGFPTTTQILVLEKENCQGEIPEYPPDPSIRRASVEQEWESLVRLLGLTLVKSLDMPESIVLRRPEDLLRSWIMGRTREETLILVAESQGQMVGFVVATHAPDGAEDLGFEIHYLGVAEAHRRQGWAKRLLKEIFRTANDAGVEKFAVYVDERNLPAVTLYERMGFREFEELRYPIVFQRLEQTT
jgi:GNAT superfamily N-acetyltransferase